MVLDKYDRLTTMFMVAMMTMKIQRDLACD